MGGRTQKRVPTHFSSGLSAGRLEQWRNIPADKLLLLNRGHKGQKRAPIFLKFGDWKPVEPTAGADAVALIDR